MLHFKCIKYFTVKTKLWYTVKVDIFVFDRVNGTYHVLNFTYVLDNPCTFIMNMIICMFKIHACFVMREMNEKFPPHEKFHVTYSRPTCTMVIISKI